MKHIEEGISLPMSDAVDVLGIGVLGVVYQDEAISQGNNKGIPVSHENKSISAKCFKAFSSIALVEPSKSLVLPVIIVLFFFLSILEDSGYMARVAFVMDKLLRKLLQYKFC